jgi:beta-xylosidase
MKRTKMIIRALLFVLVGFSANTNVISQHTYGDNGDGTFTNPVIPADYPDPDVIRVDDTYYMVTTTMFVFPGVTVLKSNDLVNWEYCSNAVPRFDFNPCYDLDGCNRYGHGQWVTSIKQNTESNV